MKCGVRFCVMLHSYLFHILLSINKLENTYSAGFYDISNKIIKIFNLGFFNPSTHLLNLHLETGTFPEKLKLAIVNPVHTKGDSNVNESYHVISILSSISKIFELKMNKLLTSSSQKTS